MVALDGAGRGNLVGLTQMGGEGAQWIGLAPFTEDTHFVQNLGDGTFFHSGSLAIRAAVAAGVSVTYKLLYNDAVAMTGGQVPEGKMSIPNLTKLLALEGVKRTVITTPTPDLYKGVQLASNAEVRHRDDMDDVLAALARQPGVTVLIHDDRCAAEERRLRKRGQLSASNRKVWINQRVCEGCADCATVSSCLSVVPVDTAFGRKTEIHQSSCNQDFSCLRGDCPSFILVENSDRSGQPIPELPFELEAPAAGKSTDELVIRMVGIGGTGIVTVAQILQMAAHLEGWNSAGLDQTGLSQKGGPVVSDVRLSRLPLEGSARATTQSLDVLLAFDALTAADPAILGAARPGHTIAVVNTTETPTAGMVRNPQDGYPSAALRARIDRSTDPDSNAYLPAEWIAQRLFDDHLPANMVILGAAFQRGCLPLSIEALEAAICLNGASVEANLSALRWGRAAVLGCETVTDTLSAPALPSPVLPAALELIRGKMAPADGSSAELGGILPLLVSELIRYQGTRYASRYLDLACRMRVLEEEKSCTSGLPVTTAFARNLYKLMAYKDEYEVARLHLDPTETAQRQREFGRSAKTRIMLHPPILRRLGLKRKVSFGPATWPILRGLKAARYLRGTPLDPFGCTAMRRIERSLIEEYQQLMNRAVSGLNAGTLPLVIELAETPDLIRGYESVKLRNIDRFRATASSLLVRLESEAAA